MNLAHSSYVRINVNKEIGVDMSTIITQTDVSQYLAQIRSYPDLTKEEEFNLADRYIQNNDLRAAEKLVVHNLKNIIPIANMFRFYKLPVIDLIQEGSIGLMKEVKRFNPMNGVRLMTFAGYWIKAEMYQYIINNVQVMKVATTKAQEKLFFNLKSMKSNNLPVTEEEAKRIASALNVSIDDVVEMDVRLSYKEQSIGIQILDDENEEYFDIPDYDSNPELIVSDSEYDQFVGKSVHQLLSSFSEREQFVIKKRLIDEDKMTLKEIAKELGVSFQRVDEIYRTCLKKLRTQLSHLQA